MQNLAFCRDGKLLALIRQVGVLEVWNVVTRQRVYPSGPDDFRGARQRGLGGVVALSPDDTSLAVQGAGGAITVWDLRRRKLVLALPEEHSTIRSLAWSPDRQRLAAGFSDGSLVLWNIPRIRAQLAEIGLDWHDSPAPAAHPEQDELGSKPIPLETARLFALELFGTAQATLSGVGNVCRVDIAAVDGTNWHARITKLFDDPQAGATYTVRFRAKADAPRPIWLSGSIDEPDWHGIGRLQDVPWPKRGRTINTSSRRRTLPPRTRSNSWSGIRRGPRGLPISRPLRARNKPGCPGLPNAGLAAGSMLARLQGDAASDVMSPKLG